MKPFGLTGNIGCGKSIVASLLKTYPDVVTLDSDSIAKEIISTSQYRQEINAILGTNVFPNEQVSFEAIAKIIFEKPEKKSLFETFIHPHVWAAMTERISSVDSSTICVVESALIFETKMEEKFSAIIVAACNSLEQLRRLREARQMSDIEIAARLDHQLPSSEKENRAQFVIHTDCDLNQLKERVDHLYQSLKRQTKSQGFS